MSDRYSAAQKQVVDRDNRNMAAAGYAMADEINSIWASIDTGNIGILAAAKDVDSLAIDGGAFSYDPDTTTGLTFGYKKGRVVFAGSVVEVAAGTIALSSSNTNYVEVDSAGTVSKNTVGWTAGKVRLWKIVTGSGSISTIENNKTLLGLIQAGGVTGSLLSAAAATKSIEIPLGDISATTSFSVVLPDVAATVSKITFATKTAISTSDTDYWTFGIVNKEAGGSGTTKIVDAAAAANSTKATGGSAITGYVKRNLTLSGTPANLVTAAEDVLEVTVTKAASATTMAQCVLRIDLTFTA
jgi:hypothetical protein